MTFHTTFPAWAKADGIVPAVLPTWTTPEWEHTPGEPFCGDTGDRAVRSLGCWCHHEPERVERYVVGPIVRGELTIPDALDIFYGRLLVGAGRK